MQGMHWEVLVIPLIAVAVWLLGTIFRGAEEERQRNRPRRPGEGVRPPRRPVTDLDRFLEEARRRRETVEPAPKRSNPFEESGPEAPPLRVPPPPPRPREQRPARPAEPRPREAVTRPVPPVRRPVSPPVALPVARPVPPAPEPESPAPVRGVPDAVVEFRASPPLEALPAPPTPPPPATSVLPARRPSPILAQVVQMLRSPRSAGAAFVLREVLDRPLSQRRRG